MPAPKPIEEPPEEEEWLATFADTMTLLMCFFIMLLTFSKYDVPAMEAAVQGIKNQVGDRKEQSPTSTLKNEIQDIVYEMQADQVIDVTTDDKGVVIELASSAFYRPGSAEFRPEAIPVLNELAKKILSTNFTNYTVEIEGHTDDDPISTPIYPSNWELSAGRASRVVRFLAEKGMEPNRLKAAGFGDTQPKVPNRTADGSPIRENQATNRRVNIRMYPVLEAKAPKGAAAKRRSILDLIETGPAVPLDVGAQKAGAAGGAGGVGGVGGAGGSGATGSGAPRGTGTPGTIGSNMDKGVINEVLKGMGVNK